METFKIIQGHPNILRCDEICRSILKVLSRDEVDVRIKSLGALSFSSLLGGESELRRIRISEKQSSRLLLYDTGGTNGDLHLLEAVKGDAGFASNCKVSKCM